MYVAAIVVAGGRGARVGGAVPKQLLKIGGESILRRSVRACDAHPQVSELVVVVPEDLLATGAALVGDTRVPCRVVAGGARRQDSVRAGFEAVSAQADVVLVHDAARPFVPREVVDRVIAAAASAGAAVPAIPVADTVKRAAVSGDARVVLKTVPRDELWLAQTPQGFRRDVLARAVADGQSAAEATDEARLVELAGGTVAIVDGDRRNVKITTSDDVTEARQRMTSMRAGTGYDLHQLVSGRPLVLAGVEVPSPRGPLGHSDGDVVCHALTDAVLGASGAGDIGQMFPNTDPQWKNAPGLDLLARALSAVHARGWVVVNADVTVILETPKLAPHLTRIREALAAVLGVGVDAVTVKGKTNEGVDAVGRGEAIASHAVVLLGAGA
ncbi:MAG: 2-C-methyl-D-erythritol 4-phosphate cytidylyltransferase [Acidimicrobiia bacterium]|nr:2-C-methyl-D-erythritol 4-phosphate cytidylyltransferase [Acidimicrobiia bacterium]